MSCLPLQCIKSYLTHKKCKYCNTKLVNNIDCFCNKNCEIFYIYSDSFSSSDKSVYKYILNLDI